MLAYYAWKHATAGTELKDADGLTPDQRFFVGMAQWACGDMRKELRRERAHHRSPLAAPIPHQRVVSNMPEFAKPTAAKRASPWCAKTPAGSGNSPARIRVLNVRCHAFGARPLHRKSRLRGGAGFILPGASAQQPFIVTEEPAEAGVRLLKPEFAD